MGYCSLHLQRSITSISRLIFVLSSALSHFSSCHILHSCIQPALLKKLVLVGEGWTTTTSMPRERTSGEREAANIVRKALVLAYMALRGFGRKPRKENKFARREKQSIFTYQCSSLHQSHTYTLSLFLSFSFFSLSLSLTLCLFVCLSVFLSFSFFLFLSLSMHLSISLSVSPFFTLSHSLIIPVSLSIPCEDGPRN